MNIIPPLKNFIQRQPKRTILILAIIWLALYGINYILHSIGINFDTPLRYFPVSIFSGPSFHYSGLPSIIAFLLVTVFVMKYASKMNWISIWTIGLLLIVLGNLGQGSFDAGFFQPFYKSDIQYYHDAIKITSVRSFLEIFNDKQPELLTHSRTHPPFAVLLHYIFLYNKDNLLLLSGMFILLSSLTIPFFWHIVKVYGATIEQSNLIALLLAVIPAFNIYSAVSLDGVIAMTAGMFLFGLCLILKRKTVILGFILFTLGFVFTNLLTFGGFFLAAAAGIIGIVNYIKQKRSDVLTATGVIILIFMLVIYLLTHFFHYDHIRTFLTASHLENPQGSMIFHKPVEYVMTRIEDIMEIALFLSAGCLIVFFNNEKRSLSLRDSSNNAVLIILSGIISLLALFIIGTYRTGETARACLFIYPYILLAFIQTNTITLKDMILLATIQTAGMQICGNYFW